VDGERLNVEKYIRLQEEEKKEMQQEKELLGTLRKAKPENKGGHEGAKMEKFGKFNKYAPPVRRRKREAGNPRPPSLPTRRSYCGMPYAPSSERH
jgi:hypothetical protein